MHILLIEDEEKVARFIKKGLEEASYTVDVASTGPEGVQKAIGGQYDVIILDVVLPGSSGLEVCRSIRQQGVTVPVLMLTALGTLQDKVTGLDYGADDYLTKPFHFQELLARLRALTRRSRSSSQGSLAAENSQPDTDNILSIDDLEINTDAKTVTRSGESITLTAREFRLLELLVKNRGKVLSRSYIAEVIWEQAFETGSNVIDVYINYLRKKIDHGHSRKLIHTVIGMGYVLR
ncbi:MAG: response regulator transcription factor [Bacteroidetes bacterium]|nr:response regulator transcription factor [Bacteroidota bacterium]MCH8524958.1 response regulator transcription factor [Balneolales bacterium]